MAGGCVLVGCGCVEVRSEFSNKFKYVLFPSMLTNPWPSTAEVRITSEFAPFTGTLIPSVIEEEEEKEDEMVVKVNVSSFSRSIETVYLNFHHPDLEQPRP